MRLAEYKRAHRVGVEAQVLSDLDVRQAVGGRDFAPASVLVDPALVDSEERGYLFDRKELVQLRRRRLRWNGDSGRRVVSSRADLGARQASAIHRLALPNRHACDTVMKVTLLQT